MTGTYNATTQAYHKLPRLLVLIGTVALAAIALLFWSFYSGTLHTWDSPILIAGVLLNSAIVGHFVLKYCRPQGAAR